MDSELKIFVNDEEKHSMALANLEQVAGAKVKLDELFMQWLSLPQTGNQLEKMLEDVKAGRPLPEPTAPSALSSPSMSYLAKSSVLSPVRGRTSSPPPRSPTRSYSPPRSLSPSLTPDSKSPRSPSPQHFTFGSSEGGRSAAPPAEASDLSPVRPTAMKFGEDAAAGPPGGTRASTEAEASAKSAVKSIIAGSAASYDVVPRFFVPGEGGRGRGRPIPGEQLKEKLPAILDVWRRHHMDQNPSEAQRPKGGSAADSTIKICDVEVLAKDAESGLPVEQFAAVAKTLCGFPSFFAAPLFRRVRRLFSAPHKAAAEAAVAAAAAAAAEGRAAAAQGPGPDDEIDTEGTIPLSIFLQYWKTEMEPYDHFDRFYRLVSQPGSRGIELRDFMPLLEELLAFHPGLAFLEGTPEFQEKYARTVIARIFYMLDPLARGYIDLRSLRRSNLLQAFHTVDMEEDINLVNDYFSYEHFYVLYCKFWELDDDHDFLLTRADLNRMDNLTHAILDRVFQQGGRPFTSGHPDKMGYEDFICFLLSEEDKTNEVSLAYWFRAIDLNGDGVITGEEMRHFYAEQVQRMADLNLEVVPFSDIMSQMTDLLQPSVPGEFRFKDFIHPSRIRLTGAFFSILFNLQKFTLFEQRDPVIVKQELNEQGITQWDRYAQFEYMKLAEEEEGGMDEADLSMELEGMSMDEMTFNHA